MKISIVITTYNRLDLLRYAIKSAVMQTYPDIEIVVVDDASSCDNKLLIDSFDFPIIYYRFAVNQGGNICRNKGVSLSRGAYVAFLDDDDTWENEKLKKQYAFMNQYQLDLSYTGKYIIRSDQTSSPRYAFHKPKFSSLKKSIMEKNFIGTTSSIMLTKESFWETGGFNIEMPALQDYEFYIRFIYKDFAVKGMDEALVNYFIYQQIGTVSKSMKKKISAIRRILWAARKKKYVGYLILSLLKNLLKSLIVGHK